MFMRLWEIYGSKRVRNETRVFFYRSFEKLFLPLFGCERTANVYAFVGNLWL